jgi:transcriptional regulator with XRE-family HTH domain
MVEHGLTQAKLAKLAKVSQPTISRARLVMPKRLGRAHRKLFNYAGIDLPDTIRSIHSGPSVVNNAFVRIWDGTIEHANAIAQVIEDLGRFEPPKGAETQ